MLLSIVISITLKLLGKVRTAAEVGDPRPRLFDGEDAIRHHGANGIEVALAGVIDRQTTAQRALDLLCHAGSDIAVLKTNEGQGVAILHNVKEVLHAVLAVSVLVDVLIRVLDSQAVSFNCCHGCHLAG